MPIEPERLPKSPLAFVFQVACGRYAPWNLALLLGEAINAGCGILLPYALGRILSRVTTARGEPSAVFHALRGPLALFALLCVGELVFGRLNSALQLRMAPRQRHYVARALFRHVHGHSHRFLIENFAGALANRIGETSHGVNQVLWAVTTELWPITIVISVSNILLAHASPWLGLFTSLWSLAFIVCSLVFARRTQPLAAAASTARSQTDRLTIPALSSVAAENWNRRTRSIAKLARNTVASSGP